jgi:hypothetical protein
MDENKIEDIKHVMDGQYTYLRTLSSKSNGMYNFLLLSIIATICALPFIRIDVSTTAFVTIQPQQLKEIVHSPLPGKIVRLYVANNQTVSKGDTIMTVDNAAYEQLMSEQPKSQSAQKNKTKPVLANIAGTGYIEEGLQPGSYIQGGQKVAEVIPNTGLVAVCYIAPKDIGYVKKDQRVQLQIDSYNYYDWGMLNATVVDIFNDVSIIEGRPFYMVQCKLDKTFLALKNGHKGDLMKGMTGRANFSQSKKTLWQLLFTKVNEWFDPTPTN